MLFRRSRFEESHNLTGIGMVQILLYSLMKYFQNLQPKKPQHDLLKLLIFGGTLVKVETRMQRQNKDPCHSKKCQKYEKHQTRVQLVCVGV